MAKVHSESEGVIADQTASLQPNTVVSTSFSRKKLAFLHGKRGFIIAAIVVIGAVTGATAYFLGIKKDAETPPVSQQISNAHSQVINGNFAAAEQNLQSALKDAQTAKEKAAIELGLAESMANDGKYEEAISHAQASNNYIESAEAYGLIGFAAAQTEKWQLSADSYAKAAELSKIDNNLPQKQYTDYKNQEKESRSNL